MANVTVRDVVRQIGQCHAALAALYSGLAATASGERVRMLAQALAAREDRLVQTTARYQRDEASKPTLDYWFKAKPIMPEALSLDGVQLDPQMTTDELSAFGVGCDAALGEFVQRISEATNSLKVQELFADLRAQQEAEVRQTARVTLSVERDL
ncbi:MAG: hypothetical protein Q8L86_19850 [Vicinamibacterales bacterium]|nr:hypothetical protein [Vicinamibacterales bacterium]